MRKSKWLKLIASVLCVAMLLLVLVACVDEPKPDPDPEPDPKPVAESLEDALNTTMQRLQDSYVVGDAKYFSVDVLADAELNTLGEAADRLWKYEVLAKANIKLIDDATEDETSMRIEINSYSKDAEGNDVKTTLFGILYENEVKDGKTTGNYFYITVAGAKPIKVNAFSMYKILSAVAPATVADDGGLDINSIIQLVFGLVITDFKAVDNDYIFTIDIQEVWDNIYGLLSTVIDFDDLSSIGKLIGGSTGEMITNILTAVDGAIADVFPGLTYTETVVDDANTPDVDESGTISKPVDSINGLLKYIDQNIPNIVINAGINFDANNKFEGATINAKYQAKTADNVYNNPTHEFKLKTDKVYVGAHCDVAVDDGYVLTKEERVAMTNVVNLLNFSINGTLEMTKKGVVEVLPYSINADIDPFVLLDGINVNTIKKLGYLNITVNAPENQSFRNILTIHADLSSGSMYLNFKGYGEPGLLSNLNIGGKIDINALFDAITIMSGGNVEIASVAEAEEEDVLSGVLKALLGALDLSDIAKNGVVMDTSEKTIKKIFSYIDLGDSLANSFLPGIVRTLLFNDSDTMAIKVNDGGIAYGGCEKINVSDIDFTAFRKDDVVGVNSPKIADDFQTKYEYGQPLTDGIVWNGKSGDADKSFNVKGTNSVTGKYNTIMSAKYLGTTYDPYKVGEQKIRIYFAANNNFNNLGGLAAGAVKNLLAGLPMLPINGIQYIETTVTVYEKVDNETAFVNIRGVNQLGVGENIADKLQGELIFENGRKVDITSSMISSKTPIISDGKIMYPGEWALDVKYFTAHATVKIVVGELFINEVDKIVVGQDDVVKALNPRIKLLTANGTYEYSNCTTKLLSVSIDGIDDKNMKIEDAFETGYASGSYVVKPNHAWLNKTMKIKLQYDMFGENKIREIEFKLVAADGEAIISSGTTSFYFNAAYNNFSKITDDGKSYYVKYNAEKSKFEAYATANALFDGDITMDIKRVKDENGKALNAPEDFDISVGYFRVAGEFEYTLTLDNGAFFTGKFKVNKPITGDKTWDTKSFYPSFYVFSFSIDGTTLVDEPKSATGNSVSFRYLEETKSYAPCVQIKGGKYQAVGTIVYKDKDGNVVEPIVDSTNTSSTVKYVFAEAGKYTVTVSIEIGGVMHSSTSTINFTK